MPFPASRRPAALSSPRTRWLAAATSVVALVGLALPLQSATAARVAGIAIPAGTDVSSSTVTDWVKQPVTNASFHAGSQGWLATGTQDYLRPADGFRGRGIALRTSSMSTAVLNDEQNIVASAKLGREYRARAWVRTATPGVPVQLRIREVLAGAEVLVTTEFTTLNDRSWHRISLAHSAVAAGSTLDLNVVSWDLRPTESVLVDAVRLHVRDTIVTDPDPEPQPDCLMGLGSFEQCGVAWGVYATQTSAAQGWAKPFTDLESVIGRQFDMVKRYHDWSNKGGSGQFPDVYERQLGADGSRTLYFAWTSNVWASGTTTKWASIASGAHDESVILPAAQRIKDWGQTVFIDFDHEMDGWTRTTNGTPADYVAAYRHIVDVFDAAGVDNVVWAWVPTGTMANRERIKAMYPGDAYVDWVGYDPYNFYNCNGSSWESPMQSLKPFYDWMSANITDSKPVLLGEYGTVSDASERTRGRDWYAELPLALESMPRIRAVMQWSSRTSTTCDFRLTRDPEALAGFTVAGLDNHVLGGRP